MTKMSNNRMARLTNLRIKFPNASETELHDHVTATYRGKTAEARARQEAHRLRGGLTKAERIARMTPNEAKRTIAAKLAEERAQLAYKLLKQRRLVELRRIKITPEQQELITARAHKNKYLIPVPLCSAFINPAVYLLYKEGKVIYVGQSNNPCKRIFYHVNNKDYDEAFILPVPKADLLVVEAVLIRTFRPPLNIGATGFADNTYDKSILRLYGFKAAPYNADKSILSKQEAAAAHWQQLIDSKDKGRYKRHAKDRQVRRFVRHQKQQQTTEGG